MIPLGGFVRSLRGRRGLGYRPDGRDLPKARDIDALGLAGAEATEIILQTGPVLDQGSTNSCVAQAICDAELTTLRNRYGVANAPLGSRRFAYWLGRKRDGLQAIDNGSRPSQVLQALIEHGLPPESQMAWDTWYINQSPSFAALWDARNRRGIRGYYKVYDHGDARWQAIRAALQSGRAVVFGVEVDAAFIEPVGPFLVRWAARGERVGRHMMQIVGTDPADRSYLVKNSYGSGWRAGGFARLDEEYIDVASDVIVVDPQEAVR